MDIHMYTHIIYDAYYSNSQNNQNYHMDYN